MWIGDFILTRVRRTYIKDFKLQMVKLYENGITRIEIIREYDLTLSIFSNWINTGSFNHQDNLLSDVKCSYHFANITRYSQQNVEFKIKNVPNWHIAVWY